MANRNQRGPAEMGPMTGRGLGRCSGNENFADRDDAVTDRGGRGRGMGRGSGGGGGGGGRGQGMGQGRGMGRHGQSRGRGHGQGYGQGRRFGGPSHQVEQSALAQEISALRSELASLKNQLHNPEEDK